MSFFSCVQGKAYKFHWIFFLFNTSYIFSSIQVDSMHRINFNSTSTLYQHPRNYDCVLFLSFLFIIIISKHPLSRGDSLCQFWIAFDCTLFRFPPLSPPHNPLTTPLKTITEFSLWVLFYTHIWSQSTMFPQVHLLYSPSPNSQVPPHTHVPILQSWFLLLISKPMFKGVTPCIPAASTLYFDQFNPLWLNYWFSCLVLMCGLSLFLLWNKRNYTQVFRYKT
jgi:hypothetical protein